jgi:hypothetical protein
MSAQRMTSQQTACREITTPPNAVLAYRSLRVHGTGRLEAAGRTKQDEEQRRNRNPVAAENAEGKDAQGIVQAVSCRAQQIHRRGLSLKLSADT